MTTWINRRSGLPERHKGRAFTLVELLVVIAIIAILASLLVPVLASAKERGRRAMDGSNLHQMVTSSLVYASDANDFLPAGRRNLAATDDYTWFNGGTWTNMLSYGWSQRVAYCQSLNFSTLLAYVGTDPSGAGSIFMGWIYWGGRDDVISDGALVYSSPKKASDRTNPGSDTLVTCLCYDSNGAPWNSLMPHVKGSAFVQYASDARPAPPADGLAVGRLDGSANWVPWAQLQPLQQADIVYYESR